MVVERGSGLILTVRMLGRVPTAEEKQEPVLKLLERADRLPGAVVCDREDTAALDIGLYVGPTPELDLIKDDLLALFSADQRTACHEYLVLERRSRRIRGSV